MSNKQQPIEQQDQHVEVPCDDAINNKDKDIEIGEVATTQVEQVETGQADTAQEQAETAQEQVGTGQGDTEQEDTADSEDAKIAKELEQLLEKDSYESGFDEKTLDEIEIVDDNQDIDSEQGDSHSDDDGDDEIASVSQGYVVDNIDDTQLLADEVGTSGLFDSFGREILEPVFENQLRLSKNSIKLAYSKLKNTILGYRDVKQRYQHAFEVFKKGNKILCRMEIGVDCINIYYALNFDELNQETFIFHSAKGQFKQTPTRVTVLKGDDKSGEVYLTAMSFIDKVMAENDIEKSKTYVPTAFAERYPFNPFAVLRGREDIPPLEDMASDKEYDYIEGELNRNIIQELMGEDFSLDDKRGKEKLEALRQQASTIKAAVAITEPIIYFFDCALNRENNIEYINMQQVLQDKFLGKILPQQYFAIAESSDRIEHLNLLAISEAVAICNENEKYNFCITVSGKVFTKKTLLDKVLAASKTEHNNLIMAFDCTLLEALGQDSNNALEKLKANGIKIMLDNTENASIKVLTEYIIDYIRLDARYYQEDNIRTNAHLDMLVGYCKVQGILTSSQYVDTNKEARHFLTHGVDVIQGFAIEEPKRTIQGAVKEIKKLAVPSA